MSDIYLIYYWMYAVVLVVIIAGLSAVYMTDRAAKKHRKNR